MAIPCRNEIEPGQVRSLLLAQLCANYVCVFIETAKQIWVFVYILQAAAHNGTMYGKVIGWNTFRFEFPEQGNISNIIE